MITTVGITMNTSLMKTYYSRYSGQHANSLANQYPNQSRQYHGDYYGAYDGSGAVYEEEEELKKMKKVEIYDVNTYDSFISTAGDITDLSSLSEAERYAYGNFNFFTLKRTQFTREDDDKKTTMILNQDGKKLRGKSKAIDRLIATDL